MCRVRTSWPGHTKLQLGSCIPTPPLLSGAPCAALPDSSVSPTEDAFCLCMWVPKHVLTLGTGTARGAEGAWEEGRCGPRFTLPQCRPADIQPAHVMLVTNLHLLLLLWSGMSTVCLGKMLSGRLPKLAMPRPSSRYHSSLTTVSPWALQAWAHREPLPVYVKDNRSWTPLLESQHLTFPHRGGAICWRPCRET